MKRLIILGMAALFLMMPTASFARTVVSDHELADVTAEAGVSIVFTNVNVGNNATTLTSVAWGDSGGVTGYTGEGWVGINGVAISGNLAQMSGTMNIDVGSSGTAARVRLALPTVILGTMSVNATMKMSNVGSLAGGNTLGYMELQNFRGEINGTVQVYPH